MNKSVQIAEYIWVSAKGIMRSKTKVFDHHLKDISEIPQWNFDGSSTGQAHGKFSDITLKPVRLYQDPFRNPNDLFVLCETYDDSKCEKPNVADTRNLLRKALIGKEHLEMMTGIEQEYVLFDAKTKLPYMWKEHQDPGSGPQGPYYCGVGGHRIFGRDIIEDHMKLCLKSNLSYAGANAEVMASQWEFQIGTGELLKMADDLWIARYILERITEKYGCYVNYHPKPHFGDWNGSGGHVNFSTKEMREKGGLDIIKNAIKKLEHSHFNDIHAFGEDNHLRLTGKHETQSMKVFTWGVADRGASIRINKHVADNEKGYFEDRRPASNLDPYLVLATIVNSIFG